MSICPARNPGRCTAAHQQAEGRIVKVVEDPAVRPDVEALVSPHHVAGNARVLGRGG